MHQSSRTITDSAARGVLRFAAGGSSGGELAPALTVVAPRYGRRDFLMRRLLLTADVIGLVLGLVVAAQVSNRPEAGEFVLWGVLTLPLWTVLLQVYGLYHRDVKRVSHAALDDLPWLFHALIVGSLLLWVYYKLTPIQQLALEEVVGFVAASMAAMLLLRGLVRQVVRRRLGRERALLVGEDPVMEILTRKIRAHPEYGLEPVGRLAVARPQANSLGIPVLGTIADFEATVRENSVERVVVSHKGVDEGTMLGLLHRSKQLGLKVSVLPQMFDVMGPSVEVDDVGGVTVLGINPPVLSRSSRALKRTMDLVGSGLLLVALAPLIAAVALAIKLDSRGPILFFQQRVGRGGTRFRLRKFRTMVEGAEQKTEELMAESEDEYWLKLARDPRITRVGRVLRFTSLDELPQLWNVLRGEMSLVGPRPLIEKEDRLIDGWGRSRLDLMPGITGSWQVLGRTNIPFEEMVKLDYLYVTNWSLWTDVRLMLRTLPAVLSRRGAN